MLATPPIHAPLEQPVYPPPRASISNSPALLHGASLGQPASRTPQTELHRHAKAAREALDRVKRLADQVDGPTSVGEGSEGGQGVRCWLPPRLQQKLIPLCSASSRTSKRTDGSSRPRRARSASFTAERRTCWARTARQYPQPRLKSSSGRAARSGRPETVA